MPPAGRARAFKILLFLIVLAGGLAVVIVGGLALAPEGSDGDAFAAAVTVVALLYAGLLSWYYMRHLRAPAPAPVPRALAVVESAFRSALANGFTETEERLRSARGKAGALAALDALPWLVVVTDSAGAGTFLRHATRHSPVANPQGDDAAEAPRGRWFVAPEFAALEIDFAKTKGQAREEAWTQCLAFLGATRAERPVDGILALVTLDTLQSPAAHVGELGADLARLADAAGSRLHLDVPVTVVVTRCDRAPGIGIFAARLGDKALTRAVGWWPSSAERQGAVDEAKIRAGLDRIEDRLRAVGLALVGSASASADKSAIWECVEALAGARPGLDVLLKAVFAARPATRLGGVFLVGDPIPDMMPVDTGLFVDDLARHFIPHLGALVATAAHAGPAPSRATVGRPI